MARIDANTGNSGKYATNKDKEESIRKPVKRRCREMYAAITIRIRQDEADAFTDACYSMDREKSEVLREFIRDYTAKHKAK